MLYIGLMSGTSLDGVDAALVEIDHKGALNLLASHYVPYSKELQKELLSTSQQQSVNIDSLSSLDQHLGRLYSSCCLELLSNSNYCADDIHAIGCHGQTIRHKPRPDAFSLQIGDANIIAENTKITTVSDFRRRDIAAGGEGAPLVPAFHQHVFIHSQKPRQILNLGGIANVTVLSTDPNKTFGFDIGPANTLSNEWVEQHWQMSYDKDGILARSGEINPDLLNSWLSIGYFNQSPPKSTGRELFSIQCLENLTPNLSQYPAKDILATLIELTAVSIAQGINKWGHNNGELFICGGGAHNQYLIERIQYHLTDTKISFTDELGIPGDMVEACAFAWLAYRTMSGLAGNLPNATGAKAERILGAIHLAK